MLWDSSSQECHVVGYCEILENSTFVWTEVHGNEEEENRQKENSERRVCGIIRTLSFHNTPQNQKLLIITVIVFQ